ncbi:SAM-dependent DNA methyltransferase [Chloroflexia bacterium SDU3-3]|nr:SAM-dependent DNA methyltransferase [Chloroflexia bacterium SDU3-3]
MSDHHYYVNFIWQIADLLRGPYRPPQYERVMLPLTVLRRFDCVLAPTKPQVLAEHQRIEQAVQGKALDARLNKVAGQRFHNHSKLDFQRLKGDPNNLALHLNDYINGFSEDVRKIFERFEFTAEIERMEEAQILYLVISKFCDVDLHPDKVDNIQMGLIFEDLIRKFNEAANETAGDHFTPREVIQLMVDLLFAPDDDTLATDGKVFKLLDPTCGTGGMLSEAQNHLRQLNPDNRLWVFGQDFNPRSYAIAASDLLMKGNEQSDIRYGDSLIDDQFPPADELTEGQFDYFLANPPFGVDWKRQQKKIQEERDRNESWNRFAAGLPRVNDGALLFLQHMVSKFVPYQPHMQRMGSRLAVVFNGSPLFTGGAGSGESEIRKWLIEADMLDAIVALPEQMFYNTGIGTYIWLVTNRKTAERQGKIQLIDARQRWKPLRRSLGDKRRELGQDDIADVVREYGNFAETATSKIFENVDFGYHRVPIERPLRLVYQMDSERKSRFLDAAPHLLDDVQLIDREYGRDQHEDWSSFDELMTALLMRQGRRWKAPERKLFRNVFTERHAEALPVVRERRRKRPGDERIWGWFAAKKQGWVEQYEPDADKRDFENVVLREDVAEHVRTQVLRHVGDAWADREGVRSAYEVNFNRHFYTYTPPRPLAQIDADLRAVEEEILHLLREVVG